MNICQHELSSTGMYELMDMRSSVYIPTCEYIFVWITVLILGIRCAIFKNNG